MQVLYTRCAGLDVHKDTVVACVRMRLAAVPQEVRSFGTTTSELLDLADWLASSIDCTHVAMEATGVYWKPVWHVLEADFELVLANAAHIRNVPGRKTDVNDAMWIADLLAHGLIRSSFVPPQAIQQLRDLTRTRKQLVREVSQHSLRIQKVLEDANLKLGSVLSDVLGKSGRAMLDAIVAGETDPARLAALAHGTRATRPPSCAKRCAGASLAHHRTMLRLHLQVDRCPGNARSPRTGRGRGKALAPIRQRARLLTTMPGVSDLTASVVVAEIGVDMSRFPTAGHLVSWAGTVSAQRRERRQAPLHPGAQERHLDQDDPGHRGLGCGAGQDQLPAGPVPPPQGRRGAKKAIIAVAASMLTAAFHMLRDGTEYNELGTEHFDRADQPRRELVHPKASEIGYVVGSDAVDQRLSFTSGRPTGSW